MKKSFFYRAFAKAQSLGMQKLMQISLGKDYSHEDLHLQNYSPLQKSAEALLNAHNPLPILAKSTRLLIVIPFRDKWGMTELCLNGLFEQIQDGLEILLALVDNGSVEAETVQGIKSAITNGATKGINVRHLRYEVPFNFSYLNNQAVRDCEDFKADVIGLVNNDIEFVDKNSVVELVRGCFLPNAGAIGCTLLYPNRKIQHLFIFVGSKIVGSHPYKGALPDLNSRWYSQPRAVGAVTGAVMFIQKTQFDAVGGFDELLPTSYQDVDLCLKFQQKGLVNWVLPKVMLIHHETQTRSLEPSWKEADRVEEKWGKFLFENPFVSSDWSRKSEHFVFTPKAYLRQILNRDA